MTTTIAEIMVSALGRINAAVLIGIQDDAVTATDWERGTIPHQTRRRSLMPETAKAAVSTGSRYSNFFLKKSANRLYRMYLSNNQKRVRVLINNLDLLLT